MTPELANRIYTAAISAAIAAGARWTIVEVTREPHSGGGIDGYFEGMQAAPLATTNAPELPLLYSDRGTEPGLYAALVTPAALSKLAHDPHRMINRRIAYSVRGANLPAGRIVMVHTAAEYGSEAEDAAIDAARAVED